MNDNRLVGLLLTVAVGVVAIVYAVFVFVPQQRWIADVREQIHTKQQFVLQTRQLADAMAETERALQEARQYTKKAARRLPQDRQLTSLFGTISEHARAAGASAVQFEPQSTQSMATLSRVTVAMGVRGRFEQVFELLRRLDQHPSPMWCDELRITPDQANREELDCEITLAIFADNQDDSD